MEQELNLLLERIAAAMSGYEPPAGAAPKSFVDMATLAGELREFAALLASGIHARANLWTALRTDLARSDRIVLPVSSKNLFPSMILRGRLGKLKRAAQTLE